MESFPRDHPDDDVGDPSVPGPERPPPPARAPRTPGRIDLDDWDAPGPRGGSRRWLLVAAVVPWIVVAAIVLTGTGRGDTAPAAVPPVAGPSPTATARPTPTVPSAAPGPTTTPPVASPGGGVVAVGGGGGPEGLGPAEGMAVVVARTWLSTRPAGPPVEGLDAAPAAADQYVEHVTVESVDHPARGSAVVTVSAVVLPVEGDRYGAARRVRLAVPVALDPGGVRPAGAPWPLPVDDMAVTPPTTHPVDDPDLRLAAAEAVTAAGYRDVALTSLSRASGWPWVVHVRAHAPQEDVSRDHVLWLRPDVGRLVVAGTAAPADARPPDAAPDGDAAVPAPASPSPDGSPADPPTTTAPEATP